jgi:glycosyltransferase involved in cell wall biosynthesis
MITAGAFPADREARGVAASARPRELNVCIVAHMAFGALAGSRGHLGGVEFQTSLLARWLAERGHRVCMITWNEGQTDEQAVDGIRVITACRQDEGWPIARFVHPRWTSLVAALRRADADLYYHNCADCVTGQVALWCRARARRFVYSVASNADCEPRLPLLTTARDKVLFVAGLRRADRIVAQTDVQRRMLRENFGLDAAVIPLPTPDRSAAAGSRAVGPPGRRVAWIGRLCAVKRPDLLLDLAERCPDHAFDLVGPEDGTAYARRIVDRARGVANVTVHGPVSRDRAGALLDAAACLVCTSEIEGFPNTFLEAWSRRVPVVSTFDPDGVIARHGLGVSADPAGLPAAVAEMTGSRSLWLEASERARRYYLAHHTIDSVMPRFESLFASTVEAAR